MSSPSSLFGGNSDGSARMEDWLRVMCRGCARDRGRGPAGGQGGMSCDLPVDAYISPYADIPEWSPDGAPVPERVTAAGFTVTCIAYQPRKRRSDAGKPHRARGMEPLFAMDGED
jgi:hypothetical protein